MTLLYSPILELKFNRMKATEKAQHITIQPGFYNNETTDNDNYIFSIYCADMNQEDELETWNEK